MKSRFIVMAASMLSCLAAGAQAASEIEGATIDAAIWMDTARKCGLPSAPIERAVDALLNQKGIDSFERTRLKGQMAQLLTITRQTNQVRTCTDAANFIKNYGR